ncbi:MAG: hypothetical protein Q9220_001143 [cf. Caloplaca sp. 1 TL-2023]
MTNIKFIPPQMGSVTNYTTRALHQGPLWLLIKDTGVLISVVRYLPLVLFPFSTKSDPRAKYLHWKSLRDNIIQALLFLLETALLILFLPALIALPGLLFILLAILCVSILRLIAWPSQGPRIAHSTMDAETYVLSQQHPHEQWIFVNGICTGYSGLQENIDRLALLFGRNVLGIHNQSYGFLADLMECLLQRCLSYNTMDVRIACEYVKSALINPDIKKVVLIGHSQGGIIVSMVLDHLFPELPAEVMGKLEIYTFGSAASHFHNPPSSIPSAFHPSTSRDTIRHIEHYANEYDMVPRWGVLYAISSLLTNRYAGDVFVRMGATGHLFVPHYMDPIFPLPGAKTSNKPTSNGHSNGHAIEEARSFLDALVQVDEDTPIKRANTEDESLVQLKGKQVNGTVSYGDANPTINGHGGSVMNGGANGFGSEAEELAELERRAKGKKVKELSRLWLYLGGKSPKD